MARHWAPLTDPTRSEARSRSVIHPHIGTAASQWGQRPLFSEPGPDQPPPEDGRIPSMMQPDDIHPEDGRSSAEGVATLVKEEAEASAVFLNFSTDNVSLPPSEAQVEAAFGARTTGFIGFIIDNGGNGTVILCIKSQLDKWWFEIFTRAL